MELINRIAQRQLLPVNPCCPATVLLLLTSSTSTSALEASASRFIGDGQRVLELIMHARADIEVDSDASASACASASFSSRPSAIGMPRRKGELMCALGLDCPFALLLVLVTHDYALL